MIGNEELVQHFDLYCILTGKGNLGDVRVDGRIIINSLEM